MDVTRRQLLRRGGLAASAVAVAAVLGACGREAAGPAEPPVTYEVHHTDDEWRRLLTTDQYEVLRRGGTERPYSSPLDQEHRPGIFSCAGCGLDLYDAATKFDSHTGWPSFWKPLDKAVLEHTDQSIGMTRTEIRCRRCGCHIGHVFRDGPKPTGLRYCMNGLALTFRPS